MNGWIVGRRKRFEIRSPVWPKELESFSQSLNHKYNVSDILVEKEDGAINKTKSTPYQQDSDIFHFAQGNTIFPKSL